MAAAFSTAKAKRILQKEGIPTPAYVVWTGGQTLPQFKQANPAWTMQDWADLVRQNKQVILKCIPSSQH